MSAKAIVVEKIDCLNVFFWCFVRTCFRVDLFYFLISAKLEASPLRHLLALCGVEPLDFGKCTGIVPEQSNHDLDDLAGRLADKLAENPFISKLLRRFLLRARLNDLSLLPPIIKSIVEGRSNEALRLSHAIRLQLTHYHAVYVSFCGHPLSRFFFNEPKVRVFVFPSYLRILLDILMRLAAQTVSCLNARLLLTAGKDTARRGQAVDPFGLRILFFPHQSIYYGKLFLKTYFQSDDPESPLHKSKILHVEFSPPTAQRTREFLRAQADAGYPTYVMEPLKVRALFCLALKYLFFLMRVACVAPLSMDGLRFALLFAKFFIQYGHYLDKLSIMCKASLAIAGYDVLFPKSLAVALKTKKIHIAAIQERYNTSYGPNFSFIFDSYYCASHICLESFQGNKNFSIKRVIPAGQIRTDLLRKQASVPFTMRGQIAPERKVLVALDFHSEHTVNARTSPDTNYVSNKHFYFDLIRIALLFPCLHIIIRGKNVDWIQIPYFYDVFSCMTAINNITISTDYTTPNVSYHLCSHADLILAKYTSLADECLAVGKQVLIHEYSPGYSSVISRLRIPQHARVSVKSWPELHACLTAFLKTGWARPEEVFAQVQEQYAHLLCASVQEFIALDMLQLLEAGESSLAVSPHRQTVGL